MNFFEENSRCLKGLFPSFEKDVLSRFEPCGCLEIIPTPSGDPTAKYLGILLHSGRGPVREARKLAERQGLHEASHAIIAGFGLGYLAEACLYSNSHGSVIVIEPDIPLFLESLKARSLTTLFSSPRFSLLLGADPGALHSLLPPHSSRNIKLVKFRPLYESHREYFDQVERVIAAFINRRDINENTLKRFGRLWVRNMFANMPVFSRVRPLASLYGAGKGFPALVLAAGPSLDEAVRRLKELKERFVIIAVDTAFNACVRSGISPDFLVVVDPQYWNLRHLDRFEGNDCLLVSESSTHPGVFHKEKGTVFFCGSIFPLSKYFEEVMGNLGKLGAGGSVATTAWDFARVLGCCPIVLAGLDLGYPDKATHYRGSFFEERSMAFSCRTIPVETLSFRYIQEAAPYYEENNTDGKTLTDKRLSMYRWWFENQFAVYPSAETLTLSAKGIRIQGLHLTDLNTVLSYPAIRPAIDAALKEGQKTLSATHVNTGAQMEKAMDALRGSLLDLKTRAEKAEALTRALRKTTAGSVGSDRIISLLERLDKDLLNSSTRDIAGFLAQESARGIINKIDQTASLREVAEQSLEMYKELVASADYHIRLLDAARARMKI